MEIELKGVEKRETEEVTLQPNPLTLPGFYSSSTVVPVQDPVITRKLKIPFIQRYIGTIYFGCAILIFLLISIICTSGFTDLSLFTPGGEWNLEFLAAWSKFDNIMDWVALSMCVYFIAASFVYQKLRKFPLCLIFTVICLNIVRLSFQIADVMIPSPPMPPVACYIEAAVYQFGSVTNNLLYFCMTINLYLNVVKMRTTERLLLWYQLFSWGWPLVWCIILYSMDMMGATGRGMCWILDEPYVTSLILTWLSMYVPTIVVILVSIVLLWLIGRRIGQAIKTRRFQNQQILLSSQFRFRLFAYTFCFFNAISLGYVIIQLIYPAAIINIFLIFVDLCNRCEPMAYVLLWGFSPSVLRAWAKVLCPCRTHVPTKDDPQVPDLAMARRLSVDSLTTVQVARSL